MKKYLLAIDGSKYSLKATNHVLRLMKIKNYIDATAVHVVNIKKEAYKFSPFADVKEIEQAVIDQGKKMLDEQTAAFEKAGITIHKAVLVGDPGYEIANYANQNGFDQIVLGTRGLSDLKGLVLGSVSHKVISLAKCNVTLVKK